MQKIDRVKEKLNDHLVEVRRTLRKPNLEYVFKQGQADVRTDSDGFQV